MNAMYVVICSHRRFGDATQALGRPANADTTSKRRIANKETGDLAPDHAVAQGRLWVRGVAGLRCRRSYAQSLEGYHGTCVVRPVTTPRSH